MTTPYIIAVSVVLVLVPALVFLVFRTRARKRKTSRDNEFSEAISLLLAGNKEEALEKLCAVVKKDTSNIDAYIKIGDLYRETGQASKAIKIHQDITVRSGLTALQEKHIYRSLILDYSSTNNFAAAISFCDKLLTNNKSDLWVQKKKLELLEKKKAWRAAFTFLRQNPHLLPGERRQQFALYKMEEGLQLANDKKEHDARVKFRQAIKIDDKLPEAYLNIADSYLRVDKPNNAMKWLKKFIEKVPEKIDIASDRMQKILIEFSDFGEIEKIYLDVIRKAPAAIHPKLSLAEIYDKKGELRRSIQLYREILEQTPDFDHARYLLVRAQIRLGNKEAALVTAMEIVDNYFAKPGQENYQVSAG